MKPMTKEYTFKSRYGYTREVTPLNENEAILFIHHAPDDPFRFSFNPDNRKIIMMDPPGGPVTSVGMTLDELFEGGPSDKEVTSIDFVLTSNDAATGNGVTVYSFGFINFFKTNNCY